MWVDTLVLGYVIYIFGGVPLYTTKNLHFIVHTFKLARGNLDGVILMALFAQNTIHSSTTIEITVAIHNILTIHISKALVRFTRAGSGALLAADQTFVGTFGGAATLLLIESATLITTSPIFSVA